MSPPECSPSKTLMDLVFQPKHIETLCRAKVNPGILADHNSAFRKSAGLDTCQNSFRIIRIFRVLSGMVPHNYNLDFHLTVPRSSMEKSNARGILVQKRDVRNSSR